MSEEQQTYKSKADQAESEKRWSWVLELAQEVKQQLGQDEYAQLVFKAAVQASSLCVFKW